MPGATRAGTGSPETAPRPYGPGGYGPGVVGRGRSAPDWRRRGTGRGHRARGTAGASTSRPAPVRWPSVGYGVDPRRGSAGVGRRVCVERLGGDPVAVGRRSPVAARSPTAGPSGRTYGRGRPGGRRWPRPRPAVARPTPDDRCPRVGIGRPSYSDRRGRTSDLEQLGFLVLEDLVDVATYLWVRSSSSFSARRPSSSPASPSLTMRSSSSLALRRTLRIATLASSPLCRATLIMSRRRSSVIGGRIEPDLRALVVGVDPEVGVPDRLLHRLDLRRVVRLDDHHAGLGDGDRGHLRQRGGRTVVVDHDAGEHGRRGPAGTDRGELVLGELDRPLHLLLGLEEGLVNHLVRRLLRRCAASDQLTFRPAARLAAVISVPISLAADGPDDRVLALGAEHQHRQPVLHGTG